MEKIILYRYVREDGGVTISPNKPDVEYTEALRLVAEKGKAITKDNENFFTVIDVASEDGYYEVDHIFEEPVV